MQTQGLETTNIRPGNGLVTLEFMYRACIALNILVFLYPIQVISSPVHSSNIRTRRHLVALFHFKCSHAYFKILGPRIDRSHVKDGRICHKIFSNRQVGHQERSCPGCALSLASRVQYFVNSYLCSRLVLDQTYIVQFDGLRFLLGHVQGR